MSYIYCTLCGRIKGTTSALSVIQHGLRGGTHYKARHVITYTRNKVSKMLSTINQLKHGKTILRLILYGYLDHIIAYTALPSVL